MDRRRVGAEAAGKHVPAVFVEGGVKRIEVPVVQIVGDDPQALAEALVVHDLPRAQEADGVAHIRFVRAEAQDVVVGHAGLLLRGEVLMDIRQGVPRGVDRHGRERVPGGADGVDPGGMVHEIGVVAGFLDLLGRQVARKLIDDGADHLKMRQFFGADIVQNSLELRIRHHIPLAQIAERRADLPVGAAVLRRDDLGERRVGASDLDGVLQAFLVNPHVTGPPLRPARATVRRSTPTGWRRPASHGADRRPLRTVR